MRRKGASIFVYLIFGILIAIFVVTIGAPGGGEGSGGCGTQSNTVVDVDGSGANLTAYRIAYSNGFNRLRSRDKVYFALETLIRREILAQAASERGLRVTGDMVDDEIKKGYFFTGGLRVPLGANIFDEHEDGTRTWNVRKFKSWVAALDVKSTSTYREEQIRSMQAALMYELLTQSTRVSREEALTDFLYSKNTVSYDVVTFASAPYRAALRLTDADVDRYLAAHEADVKARYTQDERLYKGLKPQLKLRQIFIAKLDEPTPTPTPEAPAPGGGSGSAAPAPGGGSGSAAPAAGSGAGSGSGSAVAKKDEPKAPKKDEPKKDEPKKDEPKKIGMPIEEAKAKLEAARASITANKLKFADAAKQLSTDENAKVNGGDIGWRSVENPQLGDKAVNDAVKALKPGEMTPVITTGTGAFLVIAEEKREGDLDYDKVKKEIAGELARDVFAKEAAKRAALAAIDEARGGTGKNLYDMFEKEPDADGGMPNLDFLNDPSMSEEQKKMILEQLKQQMQQQNQKSGQNMTWESKDIPVKWHAPDETSGSGSATTGGSGGSAAKPAGGSGSAVANKGSAAGSAVANKGSAAGSAVANKGSAAGSAAGGGSGTGSGAPPAEAPPTPGITTNIPPVEATKDQLPQFGSVDKPKIVHFGPESRQTTLPGLSKELTPVVFDELSAGMLAKRVYEVEGNYVLLQITNKAEAMAADFDKDADRYITRLQLVRSYAAVEGWLEDRCKALLKDKKIVPMKEIVAESDEKTGKPAPQVYRPCMYANQWLTVMLPALGYGGG